ncbi:hypothetical protein RJ527_08950 [Thalassospiraceae bacterium LMO-SO8]|nr:hypothetical protein [Alphaproteobacteria bacterium LMO-S08]WND77859.1 hypothetical protein RJ527_08950 [Thalassospiraceae bacterium LMO-SO8]
MKIYTAMVIISENDDGKGGAVHTVDVIEHGDYFWLVPEWLDLQGKGVSKPARIVSLKTIPHERGEGDPEFVVSDPVPKSVFDGRAPEELAKRYIVIESPEIVVPRTH